MARLDATSFESQAAAAWAGIIASKLFFELFVAVDDSLSTLDVSLRGEAASAFTHRLESNGLRCARFCIASVHSKICDWLRMETS